MSGFTHGLENVKLDNCTLINSSPISGPMKQRVRVIRSMNEADKSIEEITTTIMNMSDDQVPYLFPEAFDAVIQSGRVSRASATVASLLKVRVLACFRK